jgi:hypothetical protein
MARIPSHPRVESAQASPRWIAQLEVADTISEVVAITRAFVETWSAPEILRLPFWCRPGRIGDGKQVQELASLLETAQHNFLGKLVDALVLDRMLAFFMQASRAIDRIAAR